MNRIEKAIAVLEAIQLSNMSQEKLEMVLNNSYFGGLAGEELLYGLTEEELLSCKSWMNDVLSINHPSKYQNKMSYYGFMDIIDKTDALIIEQNLKVSEWLKLPIDRLPLVGTISSNNFSAQILSKNQEFDEIIILSDGLYSASVSFGKIFAMAIDADYSIEEDKILISHDTYNLDYILQNIKKYSINKDYFKMMIYLLLHNEWRFLAPDIDLQFDPLVKALSDTYVCFVLNHEFGHSVLYRQSEMLNEGKISLESLIANTMATNKNENIINKLNDKNFINEKINGIEYFRLSNDWAEEIMADNYGFSNTKILMQRDGINSPYYIWGIILCIKTMEIIEKYTNNSDENTITHPPYVMRRKNMLNLVKEDIPNCEKEFALMDMIFYLLENDFEEKLDIFKQVFEQVNDIEKAIESIEW